jgi:hypothetical protein
MKHRLFAFESQWPQMSEASKGSRSVQYAIPGACEYGALQLAAH